MSLATTRDLLEDAVGRQGAALAFNVITLEHAEGIVAGAERQASRSSCRSARTRSATTAAGSRPLLAACGQVAEESTVPVSIHLDHIRDSALAEELIQHADPTALRRSWWMRPTYEYELNVSRTRDAAARAHERGLWVEAELGAIGGKDGAHAPGVRTDPAEAVSFVAATGVDGLAVAVGSSHAMTTR